MVTARTTRATRIAAATVADAMITGAKLSTMRTTVREVRALLAAEHVHSAVVVEHGVLVAVIDQADVAGDVPDHATAARFGTLTNRVVAPDLDLEQARRQLIATGRRRLAVAGSDGTFLGLLCLKRTRAGFCSDDDIAARRLDPRSSD